VNAPSVTAAIEASTSSAASVVAGVWSSDTRVSWFHG
jgi:hypothetical protein